MMGVRVEDDDDHKGETLDPENERSKTVLGSWVDARAVNGDGL